MQIDWSILQPAEDIDFLVFGNQASHFRIAISFPIAMRTDCKCEQTNAEGAAGSFTTADAPAVDPLLQPLAPNNGFTPTMALGVDSPAIGTANVAHCLMDDQRGYSRPLDCDRGAFEFGGIPP